MSSESGYDVYDIYDVAVVGAGPAGAASAIYLAGAGWRVVLLDRCAFPREKPCAESLSPPVEPLLRELGAMDEIEAAHPMRLRGFRIFAPNGRAFQGDFAGVRDAAGESFYESALSISRYTLDAALVHAAQRGGVELREGWRLAQLRRDTAMQVWTLRPADEGEPVHARLVIAADGVHSTVARRLNLHRPGRRRKLALSVHLHGVTDLGEYGEMHIAHGRYVGIARLELPERGDLSTAALVVDETRDGPRVAGRAGAFVLETLATFPALRERVAHATLARRPLTASGLHVRARRLSDDGVLLVGDAAGYYDPFTGQGIYRALLSARLAAWIGNDALKRNDVRAPVLQRYDTLLGRTFEGQHDVEALIQLAVRVPPLMNRAASRLRRRKELADTLLAVTGDYLAPSAVLRPGFLLHLLIPA